MPVMIAWRLYAHTCSAVQWLRLASRHGHEGGCGSMFVLGRSTGALLKAHRSLIIIITFGVLPWRAAG